MTTALDYPPAAGIPSGRARIERDLWSGAAWACVVLVTLAAAILPAILWPGDVSFINDEPRHLANAYYANKAHMLAEKGLVGNFGLPYGPVPTEIYQCILQVTHDPLLIAPLRAGLSAAFTAIGLLWLARSLRLNPWFAAAVVLAPFLWVYHRILWDASWAMPMGAMGLAAYAAFLRNGRAVPLMLTLLCMGLLPFIHPQDLPLCLPILVHLALYRRRALLRYWPGVLAVVLLVIWLDKRYLVDVTLTLIFKGLKSAYPGTTSRFLSMLGPFWGGRFISGDAYMAGAFQWRGTGALINLGKVISYLVFGLIWAGIVLASVRWFRRRKDDRTAARMGDDGDQRYAAPLLTPIQARDTIGSLCLVGFVLQMGIFGVMRVPPAAQYFFGTFPIFVIFAWIAVDGLSHWRVAGGRLGGVATGVYGASLAMITLGSLWWFHGKRDMLHPPRPLPSLGQQVELARALNAYTDTTALTDLQMKGIDGRDDLDFYQRYPQALRSLRLLMPPVPGAARTFNGRLLIRYGPGPEGPETHLEVIDLGDQPAPAGAQPMDITPLPEGWEPKY